MDEKFLWDVVMIKWECECCGNNGEIKSTDSSEEIGAIDPSEYLELLEQNNIHFVGDQLWCGECVKKAGR